MEQVQMYHQTMAAFQRQPEWPTSTLIKSAQPKTAAAGSAKPLVRFVSQDVFALMRQVPSSSGVLNFASPVNPGGGVELGAHAQEESIAKGTYLVPALRQFETSFYQPNQKQPNHGLFSNAIIYSAHVRQVFDEKGMPLADHYLDIVTAAAPDRRLDANLSDDQAQAAITFKLLQTLRAFKAHQVKTLILGAFGCGVFGNPVPMVAQTFAELLRRPEFAGAFTQIDFCIYDPQGRMLQQFKQEFEKTFKDL